MTFDPKRVERRTTTVDADGNVTLIAATGFSSTPSDDLPFGIPEEFRSMVLAARNGDTSLIATSYWTHPERRQENVPLPQVEKRSVQHRNTERRFGPRATVKRSGHATFLKVLDLKDDATLMQRRKALLDFILE
jgi:hypothetical protein